MLGMQNVLLLDGHHIHSYISDNGWQEGLGEPLRKEFVWNISLDHPTSSSPLMYIIGNVSGIILTE
jgi:hypothetical protein